MTALIDLYRRTNPFLTHESLIAWVRTTYGLSKESQFSNPHRLRRAEIALRLRLYRDDAQADFERLIEVVFENAKVQAQRKKLIPVAMEQNVAARITDEVASLYDRPALRTLPDPAQDLKLHAEEKRINLHELMQEQHRLTFLCNEVLWWRFTGADEKYKLRLVTPDCFDAIPHPADKTTPAGYLLDSAPITTAESVALDSLPHYELWDDTYVYRLNKSGYMVDQLGNPVTAPEEHKQGGIPGFLCHRREPIERILDDRPGRDIVSAHFGAGLLNIMIMRLAKSQGERQPILKGPLANVAAGQPMDGETPTALPPETEAEVLDMVTNPEHYLSAKKDKLTSVSQRYGMSYEQMTNQETSDIASGKAYMLRREKLMELRNEQRRRAVIHEEGVVTLMGFSPVGLAIDHQEITLPQDPNEEIDLLDKKMRLGLDSVRAYLKRKDPSLTDEQADAIIERNLTVYSRLILKVRALNIPANANAKDPGQNPEQNGAQNSNNPASGDTTRNQSAGNAGSDRSSKAGNA
jgi:hypothetical protein